MNDAKLDGKNGKSKRTRYPKEYQINAAKMVYEKVTCTKKSGHSPPR